MINFYKNTNNHKLYISIKCKYFIMFTLIIIFIFSISLTNTFGDGTINWTEEELLFMQEHPVIKVAVDPDFVPFEFIDDDGEYKGISADYLKIISE